MLIFNTSYSPIPAQFVLVVSDQDSVSDSWNLLLQQKGCVIIQENHKNAAQTCKVVDPAVIVIDMHFSPSERLALCSELRTISSEPIILLVPEYDSSHIVDIYNAAVDECLLKPVSPAFLVIKVVSWLLRSRWVEDNYKIPSVHTYP